MPIVKLTRDGNGGYTTVDGRFAITPSVMGDGPRNKGHREWLVIDTTGRATLSRHGKHRAIRNTLYEVRDLIAAVVNQEESA